MAKRWLVWAGLMTMLLAAGCTKPNEEDRKADGADEAVQTGEATNAPLKEAPKLRDE